MRQTTFSFIKTNYKKEFGGSASQGRRKGQRPLATKVPIHLVLKSETHKIFNPRLKMLEQLLVVESKKHGIKIYDFAINWSHIHLVIKIPSRAAYKSWIRSLTSQLVQKLSAQLKQNLAGLFSLRPYTKILSWGRQFQNALKYQIYNYFEAKQGSSYRDHMKLMLDQTCQTGMVCR
jgi:REP element-mobilizing transposase RayT